MTIPDYQTLMLPLLQCVDQYQPITLRDSIDRIADKFELTPEERKELLPSGNQDVIRNRIGWASTYLRKAGLINNPSRGVMEITDRGKAVLAKNPDRIDNEFLSQFDEFIAFRSKRSDATANETTPRPASINDEQNPEELLESAHKALKESTIDDILESIKSQPPSFFEKLVIDVVVKMGYGGSRKEAGKAIGGSGDEGVDGIINEDRLGLDVIYLQAKRWDAKVGRPEIQKFAGALQGKRAKKGIFITTSDFSSEALEFVRNIDARIILINGRHLTELMWEHGVGVATEATFELKKIDSDYFST